MYRYTLGEEQRPRYLSEKSRDPIEEKQIAYNFTTNLMEKTHLQETSSSA
jgi:hypothetical protein